MPIDKKLSSYFQHIANFFTTEKIVITILLVGFLIYSNTFFNGFVMDDEGLILKNQSIHSFQFFRFFQGSIFDYGGSVGGVYYRPVQSILFSAIYSIASDHAFLYHLTQVSLHITNSLLLFFFFKKFLEKNISFIASLIFLAHPIQVEAVSYIASTQDVLFVFWGLIFLHLLSRFHSLSGRMLMPYIFLLLSMLSKESGLLFLPVGLLYIFLFQKKDAIMHVYIVCAVVVAYVLLRVGVGGLGIHSTSEFSMMRLSFVERIVHIPAILLFYLKTFFIPLDFIAVQSWTISSLTLKNFFFPLFLVSGFFISLLFTAYKTWRTTHVYTTPLFFFLWFLIGLGLHIQLTALDVTVADRYFYFPMIGLLGLLGFLFEKHKEGIWKRFPHGKEIVVIGIIVMISFLSLRTIIRNLDWKNTETLALHDLRIQKDNYQLLSALGAVYLGEKKFDKAIYYLHQSVDIYPHWGVSMYNLAVSYHMSKRPKEARMYYEKSLKNAPLYLNAYENMAILLLYDYGLEEAKEYTEKNLQKFPTSAKMWHVLALAELQLGNVSASSEAAKMYYLLTTPR